MCLFAAHLAEEGLSPQTVKSYLSAVRNLQLFLGFPDPRDSSSLPVLKRVLAGISRVYTSTNKAKKPRLPITIQVLAGIHTALAGSRDHDNILLWAIAASAFFGFFRLGELLPASPSDYNPASSLSWGDVAVDSRAAPSMVKFHLRRSKCDQVGKGVDVVVGRTGTEVCPVHAIVAYIHLRGDADGAFFRRPDGTPVSKQWFIERMRDILTALGLPPDHYAGHSFRIGAATTAALAGVEDSTIQVLGRWHSAAFVQYIRLPSDQLAAISRTLALSKMQSLLPSLN